MSRTLYARLVAYRAFGERLGVLPEPVSFDASLIHNDSGALTVEYSALSAGASLLDGQLTDGLEIALEVSDGTGYMEPDNARFVVTGRSGKTDDRTGTVKYSGQCIQWLLSKAKMLDTEHLLTDGDNKGKRPFYSANPGTIVKTLMGENAARGGVAAGLTLGFDTAKDAGGDNWARKYTLYYSLGVDLQSALSSLVQGGGCDWRTSRRRLDIYNADSGKLSRDLSKSVILQLGRDISEAPYEESISSLASTILVEGDNSLVFTLDNPAAPHPWGKWESYVSQGGVSDKATATAFMESQLADAARVRGQYTRSVITAGDVTSLPLVDYHAGDWITAPTVSHAEKTRVQEIDVSMRQGDGLTVSLALNDIKYDASVRQSKRMQGITGGASLAGSQGGKAASEHDHRVAAAPAGLTATTSAYLDSTGHARGLATVQWAAVTTATDGTALEINSYTVEWRKHVDGAPWHAAGTTDKTTLGIGNLDCGTQVEIRVRANATYSDQPGAWATPVVVTVENDVTPCSVPSKPVLSSELGVVTIHWDGKTSTGAQMEPDFDHIEVGEGVNAAVMTVISATQAGQGDYLVTGLEAGSEHSYALRSVDHAGNKSDWSTSASVTVASAVSQEEADKIQADLAANNAMLKDNTDKLSQARQDIDNAQKEILDNAAKTSTAQDTADSAAAAAGKAQGTADDAKIAASAAQSVADAAKTAAASATATAGQAKTVADAAQKAAASAKDTADNAETLANTANGAAVSAKSDAANAKTTADNASSVATQAKATADRAAQAATDAAGTAQKANTAAAAAAGIANGKADVIIQSTTPDTSMRKATTLWIDTTGGANTPKRWNGSVWMAVTDKAATDAADAAVKANNAAQTAQSTADKAQTAAANAASQANQANAAAKKAQTTADGKNLIYRGPTEPAHDGLKPGDLWWKQAANSTHVTQILTWDGTKFARFDLAANDIVAVGTISAGHLASNSVTTDKIVSGSVNADKLAANSVNADKIVSGAITADKLAANSVTAVKIAAGSITTDKVAAGQFRGYVFTGAVFQSSEAADTGIKINSTALQMWDSQHHLTVYLDGEGKNNVLTGSFQTAATGNRVEIKSDFTSTLIDGKDTYTGKTIVFHNDDLAGYPEIQGFFTSGNRGYSPRLELHSGWKTDHDPAANLFLESRPRTKGSSGSGITSVAQIMADTDYTEADDTKKSKAYLLLNGIGGSGATATLTTYAYGGDTAKTWVTAERNDGVTKVGISADAFTRCIYFGGKIGGITGQHTFQVNNWKYVSGVGPRTTVGEVTVALSPAKYGVYHAVANADCGWGSMSVHVLNTGNASQYQVMGYNAGDGGTTGDVWVDAIAWLI